MRIDTMTLRILSLLEQGRTYPEAALIVGLSLQATRMRVIRARRIGESIILSRLAMKYRRAA